MSKIEEFDAFIAKVRAARAAVVEAVEIHKAAIQEAEKKLSVLDESIERLTAAREGMSPEFISSLEVLEIPDHIGVAPSTQRSSELSPAEVAAHVRSVLRSVGRPMTRGQLVRAMQEQGVSLPGVDKSKNLGTILWRHPGQFVNLPKLGYWVKDVPIPGVYEPEE
jgi:hypothetical protein